MAKKNDAIKGKEKQNPASSAPGKNSRPKNSVTGVVILFLYAITEYIPDFGGIDPMGSQWLYLSFLNCFTSIYLLSGNKIVDTRIFKNAFFILYGAFIVISGLSFFVSYNVIESLVTYSRLLVSFIALLNLISLIYIDNKILRPLFLFFGFIVFIQSLQVFSELIENARIYNDVYHIIYNIKGNTGNKNILAASIVIKIPFLIYAIHNTKSFGKIFYLATLFLGGTSLIIVNARSSYIALLTLVLIYAFFNLVHFNKNNKDKKVLKLPGITLGIIILSVIVSQLIFATLGKQKSPGSYGELSGRIETIGMSNEGSSGRVGLWKSSLDFIRKHPVLGGGYGNWKIHAIPYEKSTVDGRGIRRHVHNDFFEVTSDTGIPNGLLYIGLFLCLAFFGFTIIKSDHEIFSLKSIAVVCLMALSAYFIDSFFNFPLERPNMQIAFVLIAATLNFCYFDFKNEKSDKKNTSIYKVVLWAGIVLSAITVYVNYEVFKSMQIQNTISNEWSEKPTESEIPFQSNVVNPLFPSIPNITEFEMPVACVKAKYLCQEGKFDEALSILNADKRSNPYLFYAEFLRARIAESTNKPDSAYYYARIANINRPANMQLYNYFCRLATARKDTAELNRAFHEICKWSPKPNVFINYSENLFACTNNEELKRNAIRSGLEKFPADTNLLVQKYFWEGFDHFNSKEYKLSIDSYSKILELIENPTVRQNIGMCYFNMGNYNDALMQFSAIIKSGLTKDGTAEFFRGQCYKQLGQIENACLDFKAALSLGHGIDPSLMQLCR